VGRYGRTGESTDDDIKRRMRFPCCMTKATATHSGYVIFIAVRRQHWLRERASVLRYKYISSLVTVHHSQDILFWLLGKVYTSDCPRYKLLVCRLINTKFAFAIVTCVLNPSPRNMMWQYILKYTLHFYTLCHTSNMLLVTYSLPVWEVYIA
jgi:hypothetical protein